MSWNYNYHLPSELIAQSPARPRDSSRLLVISKSTGKLTHARFSQLPQIIPSNSVLVFNDSKVVPARLFGTKTTGGKVEILLLRKINSTNWEYISHPGLKPNQIINIDSHFQIQILTSEVLKIENLSADRRDLKLLDKYGHTPLPPYIHSSQKESTLRRQYQTVYAKFSGSAAAPTAGLHFTSRLLSHLTQQGISLEYLTLHVGLGTFKTPTSDQIASGKLHTENFSLDTGTAKRLNLAKQEGRPIIAVGTTTCRVLESCASESGTLTARTGSTDIFIKPASAGRPPYHFKFIDGMITNFHLPNTSLLMLISALATPEIIRDAYATAVAQKYRFYSFGDACLII